MVFDKPQVARVFDVMFSTRRAFLHASRFGVHLSNLLAKEGSSGVLINAPVKLYYSLLSIITQSWPESLLSNTLKPGMSSVEASAVYLLATNPCALSSLAAIVSFWFSNID
jgi:hypothetical protein